MKIEQTTNFDEILTFAFNNGTEYNETNDYYINTPYYVKVLTMIMY